MAGCVHSFHLTGCVMSNEKRPDAAEDGLSAKVRQRRSKHTPTEQQLCAFFYLLFTNNNIFLCVVRDLAAGGGRLLFLTL